MPESEHLPYVVEPMRLDDLEHVMAIEKVAFAAPWSAQAYRYEITQNKHSTMLALRKQARMARGLARWLARTRSTGQEQVLGYAGFWLLVDEAHIATIAVHPFWQGGGLGELLLLSVLEHGATQGACRATLEVRVSNEAAISLYHKYQFELAGMRKRYYSDNHEDAWIMSTPRFDVLEFQANLEKCRAQLYTRLRDQSHEKPRISNFAESS